MNRFAAVLLSTGLVLNAIAKRKKKAEHEKNKALVEVVANAAFYLGERNQGKNAEDYVSPLWYNLVVRGMTLQQAMDEIEKKDEALRTAINRIDIVY